MYDLTFNSVATNLSTGNPTIANPAPTNAASSSLTLSGLAVGTWGIKLSSVSMAGVRCEHPATLQWQVVASAPDVVITVQPDAVSGSRTPVFRLGVDASNTSAAVAAALRNITFQVSLLGDAALGAFHAPSPCLGAALVLPGDGGVGNGSVGAVSPLGPLQRDCSSALCDGLHGCTYMLSLPSANTYTLQVKSDLSGSPGSASYVLWKYVVCSSTEYAVLSGNDTITCLPCPEVRRGTSYRWLQQRPEVPPSLRVVVADSMGSWDQSP